MGTNAEATVLITHDVGLHARPSVKFTKLAKRFAADIEVAAAAAGPWVDAKSIVVPVAPVAAAVTRVLVVDDDPAVRELLGEVARSIGCEAVAVGTAAEARRAIAKGPPVDVLVADVKLPDGDGLGLLAGLRKRNPAARAVVVTGDASVAAAK